MLDGRRKRWSIYVGALIVTFILSSFTFDSAMREDNLPSDKIATMLILTMGFGGGALSFLIVRDKEESDFLSLLLQSEQTGSRPDLNP